MKRFLTTLLVALVLLGGDYNAQAADIFSTQAGAWSNTATWGGSGPPGPTDVAKITHAVTFASNTTSAYSIFGGGSLTPTADDLTFTQAADCRIGGSTAGDTGIGTFTFGPGTILAMGAFDTFTDGAIILSTATQAKQAKVTGSGSFKYDTVTGNERFMQRQYDLSYVSFLTTGVVDLTMGYAFVTTPKTEISLDHVLFKNSNKVTLELWRAAHHLDLDTIHFVDSGEVLIIRKEAAIAVTDSITNIYCTDTSPTGHPRLEFENVAGELWDVVSNVYLDGYRIATRNATTKLEIDGLFYYVNKARGNITSGILSNGETFNISNFYARVTDLFENPHVMQPRADSTVTDGIFEVEYDVPFNDDGECVIGVSGDTLTLERLLSIRTSGLFAEGLNSTAGVTIDRCTVYATDSDGGTNSLVKLESTTGYTGPAVVKNSIHYVVNADEWALADLNSTGTLTVDEAGWINTNNSLGDIFDPVSDIVVTSEHDITTFDPEFADPTRDLATWGGSDAAAVSDLFTISGIDLTSNDFDGTASGVTLTDLIEHVQAGFAPTNAALQGAGEGGVDIGAVDVVVTPVGPSGGDNNLGRDIGAPLGRQMGQPM